MKTWAISGDPICILDAVIFSDPMLFTVSGGSTANVGSDVWSCFRWSQTIHLSSLPSHIQTVMTVGKLAIVAIRTSSGGPMVRKVVLSLTKPGAVWGRWYPAEPSTKWKRWCQAGWVGRLGLSLPPLWGGGGRALFPPDVPLLVAFLKVLLLEISLNGDTRD